MNRRIMQNTLVLLTTLAAVLLQKSATSAEREPFNDRYCTTCHGTEGKGNEGIQAPRLAGMEGWYLRRQLENFRAGIRGTHPMDREGIAMQPMANLSDESMADIVEWVGGWPYVPAEVTITGDAAAGRSLYGVGATCHGDQAQGNVAMGAPALAGQNDWYLVTQLKHFVAGYRGKHAGDAYGQQMAAMVGGLGNETAILNVVSYINTLEER